MQRNGVHPNLRSSKFPPIVRGVKGNSSPWQQIWVHLGQVQAFFSSCWLQEQEGHQGKAFLTRQVQHKPLPPFYLNQHLETSVRPPQPVEKHTVWRLELTQHLLQGEGLTQSLSGEDQASPQSTSFPGSSDLPLATHLLTHLHNKPFVMAAPCLRNELIFEAASLLIKLHNGVLAMLSQNRPLLFDALRESTNKQTKPTKLDLGVSPPSHWLSPLT